MVSARRASRDADEYPPNTRKASRDPALKSARVTPVATQRASPKGPPPPKAAHSVTSSGTGPKPPSSVARETNTASDASGAFGCESSSTSSYAGAAEGVGFVNCFGTSARAYAQPPTGTANGADGASSARSGTAGETHRSPTWNPNAASFLSGGDSGGGGKTPPDGFGGRAHRQTAPSQAPPEGAQAAASHASSGWPSRTARAETTKRTGRSAPINPGRGPHHGCSKCRVPAKTLGRGFSSAFVTPTTHAPGASASPRDPASRSSCRSTRRRLQSRSASLWW